MSHYSENYDKEVRKNNIKPQTCNIQKPEQMQSLGAAIRDLLKDGAVLVTIEMASQKRRDLQNRLAFHWYAEYAEQSGQSKEEARAYCKLHHGVAIAKEDKQFRVQYDRIIKPLSYEDKKAAMIEPFNLPVTSRFTIKQMNEYLTSIERDLTAQGFRLTTSENLYFQAMGVEK